MMIKKLIQIGELVKFSHSIFALPFALAAMLIAAAGPPSPRTFLLIVFAMVAARTAAMSFNRYLDASIDARNPRTADRHLPRGVFSRRFVLLFSLANATLFIVAAALLNRLCLLLSPIALLILYAYSFAKRVTNWTHLLLGVALGMSPIAAWIAVTGTWSFRPILLGLAVVFWVAGFDIIYAAQDLEFDRREGIHSLPAAFGIGRSLWIARGFHLITVVLLALFGREMQIGWPYYLSLGVTTVLFVYEHSLVKPADLSKVDAAFFNVNGFISLVFLAGVVLSV